MTATNESARLSSSTGANATLQISSFYPTTDKPESDLPAREVAHE